LPVSVCVSVSGLASGSYAGTVTITATGPNSAGEAVNNSPSHVPVMLTITGTGTIPAPLPHRSRTDEND
jgi:hypothetical protein